MSEQWQTAADLEKTQIRLGLRDKVDLLETRSNRLRKYSILCRLSGGALLAASLITDRYTSHNWGNEQSLYASLGGLMLGISALGYRQRKSAKNRAFDIERQLIELELETD